MAFDWECYGEFNSLCIHKMFTIAVGPEMERAGDLRLRPFAGL